MTLEEYIQSLSDEDIETVIEIFVESIDAESENMQNIDWMTAQLQNELDRRKGDKR